MTERGAVGTDAQPALDGVLDGLPRPRARRVRAVGPVAAHLPVARCVVDRPVPHLDRVFEYAVPASMDEQARPGVRVRVRFGGQDVDGYLVERADEPEHDGELVPLRRVVSGEVVLTAPVLGLARRVAARWAGTLPDVLRLAVPPRHARTEAEPWAREERPGGTPGPVERAGPAVSADDAAAGVGGAACIAGAAASGATGWDAYMGGTAFLRHVASGGAPRAVWSALPGGSGHDWTDAVADAVVAARAGSRGALVVVATAAEVEAVGAALSRRGVAPWRPGADEGWVRLVADDGPAARYRSFLAAVRGSADVVVGTRAAAFAPVRDLGLAVCWDEADPLHAEPRAPYPHVREVLAMRSTDEGAALLVGGHVRSTAAQRWVEDGFA
ncbi:primosomal protein N', partial [Actinotalea sp. AC32]|nr:primosomal protein N' [Actinotalea sp. AC32]